MGAHPLQLSLCIPVPPLVSSYDLKQVWHRTKEDGMGRDKGGIEIKIPIETMSREELRPMIRWMDIDMGNLVEVQGSRGEEDSVTMATEVADGHLCVAWREVFDDLNAGNKVVVAVKLIGDRGDFAEGLGVRMDLRDRPRRYVEPFRISAVVAESLDQKANCAPSV
jgi:hypothetical protein